VACILYSVLSLFAFYIIYHIFCQALFLAELLDTKIFHFKSSLYFDFDNDLQV